MAKKNEKVENNAPEKEKKPTKQGSDMSVNKDENENSGAKESFFKSTLFVLILAIVAFAGMLTVILMVSCNNGFTFKSLFGLENEQLDYLDDALSEYIDIKESDYKGIKVNIPIAGPTDEDVELEIQRLIATHRKGPKDTSETWYIKEPIQVGHDALVYYVAYTLDDEGRKLIIDEASNHKTASAYRYTVGTGSGVFGVGFDEALVGKIPIDGGIGEIRDTGYVTDDCVIYATVSYVMDNGLLYDSVDVCIDPSAPDFENKWGIGAKDLFCGYNTDYQKIIGTILLTGENYETFLLPDGRTITYTAVTVNYVTESKNEPYTVESTFTYNYSVEELRGKTVLFDVYVEKTVVYDTYEFDEDFVTNKIRYPDVKYDAKTFEKYEGETATEKYVSYLKRSLETAYESYCRSYAEQTIWNLLKGNLVVKTYPQTEIDNVYLSWDKYYKEQFAKEQSAGAGYEDFDEYMVEILELGEGGDWTSVLLGIAKDTVKERLITYAVLRDAGILPDSEEYKKIYEEELLRDYNYANSVSPGAFPTIEDYKKYLEEDRGLSEYEHDVYYYYVTDKLVEMAEFVYPE